MREKMQVSVCFLMFSIEMVSPFQDVFLITKREIQSLFVAGAWNLQILGQDSSLIITPVFKIWQFICKIL